MGDMTGPNYTKKGQFRCQLISWSRVVRMSQKVANMIRSSGYEPDIVIAIGRGGYVPARIICDYLLFRDLTSIKIEHWGAAAAAGREATIRFGLSTDISGMSVLVVDDITDTGDTMVAAVDYIKKQKPRDIRTAVLQHKTCSTYVPDFYAHKITRWRWIIYPWAAFEDMSGFIRKVVEKDCIATDEIQFRLQANFQLSPGLNSLSEILKQMARSHLILVSGHAEGPSWKNPVDKEA